MAGEAAKTSRRGRRAAQATHRREEAPRSALRQRDREPWLVPVLGAAFLVSGAAGLIHEVVWTRLLGHLFGVSSFAISTVLGAYMAGLALGSWWMGSRVERFGDQRRVYAWLELGIGAFALLVPGILAVVEPLYGWIWREFQLSFAVFSALRLAIAGAILLVPTVMMGATLPALAEYLARREGRRLAPSWLYTLNLGGAVVGVAAAGFVLMPGLGVWGTIVAGASLNIGVAAIVLLLPAASLASQDASDPRPPGPDAAARAADPVRGGVRAALLAAACVSGFLSLSTQIAWNRVLVLVVGSTTYAFTSVLVVYLLCLGLGGALASRVGEGLRRPRGGPARDHAALQTSAVRAVGGAFALTAVLTVIAVGITNRLPQFYLTLYSVSETTALGAMIGRGMVAALVVLFPPVLAAGTILPLALAAAAPAGTRGTGTAVGEIYAVNTLGSIGGSLLGGFVLVPYLGTQNALLLLAGVAVAMALVSARASGDRGRLLQGSIAGAAAVLAGFVALPRWHEGIFHSGVFEPGRYVQGFEHVLDLEGEKTVFYREGRSASVLVTAHDDGMIAMRIDARTNASTHPGDMSTQMMLAHLPILLAPQHRDVFVVGWGSGVTAGSVLRVPGVEHLTAVELEPAVVEGSKFFEDVNHDPYDDPRLTLYEDDARHILLASDRSYDVIISEPPHPWVSGVANLFTRDFYRLAATRLRPDGVYAQWIQSYQMSLDTYRSILATFTSVFPNAIVSYTPFTTDTIVVGSRQPIDLDPARLQERLMRDGTRDDLRLLGIDRAEMILATLVLGSKSVTRFAAGAPINTDDNMLVEFQAAAGALKNHAVWFDIEKNASPLDELVARPEAVLDDPEALASYAEGLELNGRDARRWRERLGAPAPPSPADGAEPVDAPPGG